MSWTIKHNLKQTAIAVDQLVRCLIGVVVCLFRWDHKVWADETMSAYLWRQRKYWYVNTLRVIVDILFYIPNGFSWGHCEASYESEKNSLHLPEDER